LRYFAGTGSALRTVQEFTERKVIEQERMEHFNFLESMDRDVAATIRMLLAAAGPVQSGPGKTCPEDVSVRFG